jgi:hypothetical protein
MSNLYYYIYIYIFNVFTENKYLKEKCLITNKNLSNQKSKNTNIFINLNYIKFLFIIF